MNPTVFTEFSPKVVGHHVLLKPSRYRADSQSESRFLQMQAVHGGVVRRCQNYLFSQRRPLQGASLKWYSF